MFENVTLLNKPGHRGCSGQVAAQGQVSEQECPNRSRQAMISNVHECLGLQGAFWS